MPCEQLALADPRASRSCRAQPGPRSNELELPGSVQAYTESPIYARTNGYLLRWYKDIGAGVEKGELLADLLSLIHI